MKQNKRRRDIKSRLIAAVCMLMVSVIMMVSSSYAWFTLSTAPEVKGIQTAVGANGNLEIALLGTKDSFNTPDTSISSAVGDSSAAANKSPITANLTWGNLVDLSDSSYGLSMISLMPAKLQSTDGVTLAANLLAVPTYGADGRVNELTANNTIAAPFDTTKSAFAQVITDTAKNPNYKTDTTIEYGVRAVGTSSNRSLREITYDTSLAQAGVFASQFRSDAIASLSANGNGLASLGTKNANGVTTFTQADVAVLQAVIDSILGTREMVENETTGAMEWNGERADDGLVYTAGQALAMYKTAAFASSLNGATYADDDAFTAALQSGAESYTNDSITALQNAIVGLRSAASQAQATMPTASGNVTWAQISTPLGYLFDSSKLNVWGMTISQLMALMKEENGMTQIMDLFTQNNNKVIANITGGVYSLMADMCGDFSVTTGLYINEDYQNMPTTMVAKRTSSSVYLNACSAAIAAAPAPKGTGDSPVISDAYGYIVDLAFRTNASDSNLMLQTAATQRISSSTNESTQGGGSSMTFRAADENFTTAQMANLMSKIVVVFYAPGADGEAHTILCEARLDMGVDYKKDASGNELTEDHDNDPSTPEVKIVDNLHYIVNEATKTITANLYVWGYMPQVDETGKVVTDDNGEVVMATEKSLVTMQEYAVITGLDAGVAKKISALVYLDGEQVTNADVAVGNSSMSGTLNLQFSSSANLVPMSYTGTYAPANPVPEATAAPTTTP